MKSKLEALVQKIWFQSRCLYWVLIPLSLLYGFIATLRRKAYQIGLLKSYRARVPVLVIGNLTVGGNGKTPLVVWLVEQLHAKGIKAGVISRGYGGQSEHYPLLVTTESNAKVVGDEPVLIHQRTGVPLVVAPKRADAVELLLQTYPETELIITDDGLQHYALARDLEWVVIDHQRKFGNGWWIPAGPMREKRSRLSTVNAVILNCGMQQNDAENELIDPFNQDLSHLLSGNPIAKMSLYGDIAINLVTGESRPISSFKDVMAIAAIGDPNRFFTQLQQQGLTLIGKQGFADHHAFTEQELIDFAQSQQHQLSYPLFMTEKDAVKCRRFAKKTWWYLPINANINSLESENLLLQVMNKLDQSL